MDGLNAAMYGALQFENGGVVQSNFNDYPMLRINEAPVIEVNLLTATNLRKDSVKCRCHRSRPP